MPRRSNGIVGYPPLDTPKVVAPDIWVVDGAPLHPGGITLPIRMTVVRVPGGGLWLHSPVRFSDALGRRLAELGSIQHLVIPNIGHWTLASEWQGKVPDAVTWAAPNLAQRRQVRRSRLRIDRELGQGTPTWAADIDQVVVPGFGGFREVAFLHRASRTLILTDLMQSLEPDRIPARTRLYARTVGTLFPRADAPVYLRAALRLRGRLAREAMANVIGWGPERVIFSHGRWFDRDGTAALQTAFGSLTEG